MNLLLEVKSIWIFSCCTYPLDFVEWVVCLSTFCKNKMVYLVIWLILFILFILAQHLGRLRGCVRALFPLVLCGGLFEILGVCD